MQRRTVVFDFDGTLALGRGPLDAYAASLGPLVGEDVVTACQAAIGLFDAGGTAFKDAYDAVRVAALEHGATDDQLSAAYLHSRELLATGAAPIHAPDGLVDFMAELARSAVCVLATNAPEVGIDRALSVLGVTDALAGVHCAVGKPAGLGPIIAAHLTHGPTLAVGDIWENDLAPAQLLGADTALVGVTDPAGTVTMRGATLTDLYDDILAWATRPRTPTPVPLSTGHAPGRAL